MKVKTLTEQEVLYESDRLCHPSIGTLFKRKRNQTIICRQFLLYLFFYNHHPSTGENHLIIFHWRVQMIKKRTQLKAALLLAATINVSYAAEVCFPPAKGTDFSDVLQCMQDKDDAQQQQIEALKKENQRLANIVRSSQRQIDSQQQRIAALEPKKEKPLRYIDNGDGTVTDKESGLTWLKNANCFGTQQWQTAMQSAKNLKCGQCCLSDGSTAGMWRLPTREELVKMVDERYRNPALSNAAGTGQWKEGDAFSGVQTYNYWTSAEYAHYSGEAWYVDFDDGGAAVYGKSYIAYVWPVRRRQ